MIYDVVIIGGGPAGITAAIYTARAGLKTILFEADTFGGQMNKTELIENFPGFEEGIQTAELEVRMLTQAMNFGAKVILAAVDSVNLGPDSKVIYTGRQRYETRTLIVATGSTPRPLGVPGEDRFVGKSLHYCAVCDAPRYKGKKVIVIGGGNSAIEEALYLLRFVETVTIIHEFDHLQASMAIQQKALQNERISFVWESHVIEVMGNGQVEGVKVKNLVSGKESVVAGEGVFVFIGNAPRSDLFVGQLALDSSGYIITDSEMRTSVPGVFAVGDVRSKEVRQVIVSAGEAAVAAVQAERYLNTLEGTC